MRDTPEKCLYVVIPNLGTQWQRLLNLYVWGIILCSDYILGVIQGVSRDGGEKTM